MWGRYGGDAGGMCGGGHLHAEEVDDGVERALERVVREGEGLDDLAAGAHALPRLAEVGDGHLLDVVGRGELELLQVVLVVVAGVLLLRLRRAQRGWGGEQGK